MIIEFLWGLVTGIVSGLFSLVPAWNVDVSSLVQTSTSVGGMAGALNGYFPVTVLGVCLVIVLGLKVALSLWRIVVFVYEHIPFKAT